MDYYVVITILAAKLAVTCLTRKETVRKALYSPHIMQMKTGKQG